MPDEELEGEDDEGESENESEDERYESEGEDELSWGYKQFVSSIYLRI